MEWGIRIPYVSHGEGSLDSFIEGWHDAFSLPQSGRDVVPRDQLTYRYTRDGNTLLNLTSFTEGLGDVRINGAWQWYRAKTPDQTNIALRGSLSLPTGDSNKLLGSGGIDTSLWVSADRAAPWFTFPGSIWGGAGMLLLGEGDVLANQQRDTVLFGRVGGGAKVWPKVSLKLQLDIHTAVYNKSSLTQINSTAVQLVMGGDIATAKNMRLDLAVKEDLTVHASPDVVFHIGLIIDN